MDSDNAIYHAVCSSAINRLVKSLNYKQRSAHIRRTYFPTLFKSILFLSLAGEKEYCKKKRKHCLFIMSLESLLRQNVLTISAVSGSI